MAPGFSPLDEALGLGDNRFSGQVVEWLVRLGAELPFARAAFWLRELTGLGVSAATLRGHTEAVGATAVVLAEAEVTTLLALQELPELPEMRPRRRLLNAWCWEQMVP